MNATHSTIPPLPYWRRLRISPRNTRGQQSWKRTRNGTYSLWMKEDGMDLLKVITTKP